MGGVIGDEMLSETRAIILPRRRTPLEEMTTPAGLRWRLRER
jgi:hypothetical protein